MSNVYGYTREAVRVKVKKLEGNQPAELRKFSVDPQITSFEVLQSILAKAFDLKGEFTIRYRLFDVSVHETYMPLLSDWDLDAAFIKAYNMSMSNSTEPCLCLRVDLKPFEECSDDWDLKQNVPIITQFRTSTCQEARPAPRLHGIFNQVGRTLNLVQKAFNFGEEGNGGMQPPRHALSDNEFRTFLDPVGQIIYAKELRSVIYFGGIDPSLRKVVWKHLLNVYPEGMSGRERMDYIKRKAAEYVSLRETWKSVIAQGPVTGELAYTTGMVRKDVLRTDRHHPFYAGSDDNQNIASLFNILTTYALNHPKVSYCQGMSDLASPLLVTMNDEAHAYICFCALMQRLSTNFMIDGIAMTQKFTHLAEGLMYYDLEFYNYLKSHQADDLLFCYRWLLLEMKREFAFEDSLRMLEVLWSSLPADPPEKELRLFDLQFQPTPTPPISPLVKTPRENAYTKVCALRRQSSSNSLGSYGASKSNTKHNHSLDENIGRRVEAKVKAHQSLDDAALSDVQKLEPIKKSELRPRSVSPLESKSDSIILINQINTNSNKVGGKSKGNLSSSMSNLIKKTQRAPHFKEFKDRIQAGKLFQSLERLDQSIKEEEGSSKYKMVKNLNEFFTLASINKSKISDKLAKSFSDVNKPKIFLTKSSFDDDSLSSSCERTRISSSNDDTFDEYSPDDSQEYFPLTTSVTRELKLELENLDRKVFGDKFIERLSESPSSEPSSEVNQTEKVLEVKSEKKKKNSDDVFLWENPLLGNKTSTMPTPDEQVDLEYDSDKAGYCPDLNSELPTVVNETTKIVTPIKIINTTPKAVKQQLPEEPPTLEADSQADCLPILLNGFEEGTEAIKASVLPAPNEFGGGNPFLMFLCITVLLQHREQIITKCMDYNEMAMHFDKMVRKHNVTRVLNQARQMYARYIKQHTILAQQKCANAKVEPAC